MTYSPLCTSLAPTIECSARTVSPVRVLVLHHGATTSLQEILNISQPGGRVGSEHQAIKDQQRVGVVPEEKRAWSLSDPYWDSLAFTIECANESTAGWTISAASHESLAQSAADWSRRYNIPIIRSGDPHTWTLLGHREVYTIWGGSYATACPGGMNLDWIAQRANQIFAGNGSQGDEEMLFWRIFNPGAVGLHGTYWMLKDGFLAVFPGKAEAEAEAKRWGRPLPIEELEESALKAYAARYYGIDPTAFDTLGHSGGTITTWFRPNGTITVNALTPAQDAKVMGSAQADKLGEVKVVVDATKAAVDKVPTAAQNAKATNDDASTRLAP